MFDLKKFLIEHKVLLKEAEWGFDLTSFTPGGFQKVLQGLGIQPKPGKHVPDMLGWQWAGAGIVIITGNDPISGKYAKLGGRQDEKDYASYIGLSGDPGRVKLAVQLIKQNADGIKDESPNTRDFI